MATADPKAPRKRVFELKIGADTYSVTRINVMKGFSLFPLFAPAIGRAIARVVVALQATDVLDEAATSVQMEDVQRLFDDDEALKEFLYKHAHHVAADMGNILGMFRPSDIVILQRELLAGGMVTKNGRPLFPRSNDDDTRFEEEMGGEPFKVGRLLWFALQVNYADFLLAAGAESAPLPAASPSPASST